MSDDELRQLIDEVLEGSITESDFLRLEAQLHVDEAARRIYYDRIKLDTLLREEAATSANSMEKGKVVPFPGRRRNVIGLAVLAASLFFLLSFFARQSSRTGSGFSIAGDVPSEPQASGFGVVAEQFYAVWKGAHFNGGDLLPGGVITLESGVAQLELFSGVSLILEGAAEFEIHSPMDMSLYSGKLRARVPEPARGFRLRTREGEVVDLGTEFALDVSEKGKANLEVFDGEVEWRSPDRPVQLLGNGQTNGKPPGFLDQLPRFEDLANRKTERRDLWESQSRSQSEDEALIAYFPMTESGNWNRKLTDQSERKNDGFIVRANRSSDRWGTPNQALDFSPTGSRVRLTIPGEYSALTFYCWVRIDSLDRWYNSLFLTDGHELHEPHWQIMNDGRIFFSVKARDAKEKDKDKHVAFSPPIWTPQLSGQWMQLATVYDSSNGVTIHYVNGRQVSRDVLEKRDVVTAVKIGAASIGNWSEPMREDPHFAVRNLNGSIDEFAIFSRPLSEKEIFELYQIGKP